MKKIFTYLSILMGILLLQSCSKQSSNEMLLSSPQINTTNINATLKGDGTYQLALDNFENAVITKQASHFQISETSLDSKTGLLVYKYRPAGGYIGIDEVSLSTSKKTVSTNTEGCNNNGSAYHTVTTNISIKLNVTGN